MTALRSPCLKFWKDDELTLVWWKHDVEIRPRSLHWPCFKTLIAHPDFIIKKNILKVLPREPEVIRSVFGELLGAKMAPEYIRQQMKTDQHNLSNEILRTYSYRVQSSCGAGQLYQNNSEICKTVQTDSVCFLFFF